MYLYSSPYGGFVCFVVLVVYLFVHVLFAGEMSSIARQKGYKKNYFWWCFLVPLYGFMIVVSLPNKSVELKRDNDSLPEL